MKRALLFSFALLITLPSFCQGLEYVAPILLKNGNFSVPKGTSFILTANNTVEIIDADQPWPPRWFASTESDQDSVKFVYVDGRIQNGYFTVCKLISYPRPPGGSDKLGYIRCNNNMEPIDTFNGIDLKLNYHDFRINAKGERMVLAKLDTVLNLSGLSGNPRDTAVKSTVDIIEVADAKGKVISKWNPVQYLGANSLYFPYGYLQSLSSKPGYVDWSHGNSVSWDFDGNILYSFRHIGIGKISGKDGSVIWRFDRNKMPYIFGQDTLAFYLQHALERIQDFEHFTRYSLYSNGDSLHPQSRGVWFDIGKGDGKVLGIHYKYPVNVVHSLRSGNFEMEPDGGTILNYGENGTKDADNKVFMEYCVADSVEEYWSTGFFNPYGVHRYQGAPPIPRPEIVEKDGWLSVKGDTKEWTWYQLTGTDNTSVRKVGQGSSYSPMSSGTYCVVGKYGIGWVVSKLYSVK